MDAKGISKKEASGVRIRFACDLYSQIRKESGPEKNIMLAPTTLGTILATVLIGSRGRTRAQILSSLFLEMKCEDLDPVIEAYANPLSTTNNPKVNSKRQVVLYTASKLYGEQSYELDSNFTEKVDRSGMEMEKADFAKTPDVARKRINKWVTEITNGAIKDLFQSNAITDETALAIVAATYFEGTWKRQFHYQYTKPGNFYTREGEAVKVDFMSRSGQFEQVYSSSLLDADMLELPYLRDDYCDASMIIILPKTSMEKTEEKLSADNLIEALSKLLASSGGIYNISIPKFEVTAEYDLIPTLSGMGMTDLVTPGLADLRSMLSPKNENKKPLYLQSAVHKTVLKVNEAGTVGAGASGSSFAFLCMPEMFTCDHPFLTVVFEKKSQTVIFIGRIMNPPPYSS